jgi:hypothetical protein
VIGARPFLIAFNVYLTSDNVSIAEKIAKAVRHSSGGLRFVKALGLLVDGRAQVSMNLTDFHKTPLARVVELIRREASRYGVAIERSELVGLIPQDALVAAAVWYLQLDSSRWSKSWRGLFLLSRGLLKPWQAVGGRYQQSSGVLPKPWLMAPTPGGSAAACAAMAYWWRWLPG